MNNQTKRRLSLLIVLAVMALIFFFSAQEGEDSAELSNGVTLWALNLLVPGFGGFPDARKLEYLQSAGYYVRKLAHFSEYALLGLTLSNYLHYVMEGRRFYRIALTAWIIATLYAMTDELHQMFVGGRGPAVFDVCIDSAGAVTGAFIGIGLIMLWHKRKRNRLG